MRLNQNRRLMNCSKINIMNKHYIKSALVILLLSVSLALYSQPANVAINKNGVASTKPAILDLSDASNANLGFLLPNVSLVSITDNTTIVGAATGLLVWNTNALMTGGQGVGFYYWTGSTGSPANTWLYILNSGIGSTITGAGTAGYVSRWTSASNLGTGVAQDNGTGVSISSTALTPVNKLDVKGNAAFGSYAGTAAPANGIIIPGQVGIGTSTPNASAALDITSATQGLLPPRIANPSTIVGPATGLVVLNSTTGCLQYYTGAAWQNISCPCSIGTPGTIGGPTSPTINTSNTYTVATVPGATSYFWSVSTTNGVIISGQGTTSTTIAFSGTAGTMNICVYAISGFCNSATSCLSVTSINCLHSSIPFLAVGATTWTVPACISQITVTLNGASGGNSGDGFSIGANGGTVIAVVTVAGGSTLNINVGGAGGIGSTTSLYTAPGGFNGGGASGTYSGSGYGGGGGGGATDIRIGGNAWANVVLSAGGGGGAGNDYHTANSENGGPGGTATALAGSGYYSGVQYNGGNAGGGSTTALGGLAGTYVCSASAGTQLTGGVGCGTGGGGGGGYYGGGGGSYTGGGGAMNYVAGPGVTSVSVNTTLVTSGNGSVLIQY